MIKTATRIIPVGGRVWKTTHPHQSRGLTYFERLASILEVEPVEKRDLMIMAMLRPLGIKPGVKFNPTDEQKAIFKEAATVGEAR